MKQRIPPAQRSNSGEGSGLRHSPGSHPLSSAGAAAKAGVVARARQRMLLMGVTLFILACISGFVPAPLWVNYRAFLSAHTHAVMVSLAILVWGLILQYLVLPNWLLNFVSWSVPVGMYMATTAFFILALTGSREPVFAPEATSRAELHPRYKGSALLLVPGFLLAVGGTFLVSGAAATLVGLARKPL